MTIYQICVHGPLAQKWTKNDLYGTQANLGMIRTSYTNSLEFFRSTDL